MARFRVPAGGRTQVHAGGNMQVDSRHGAHGCSRARAGTENAPRGSGGSETVEIEPQQVIAGRHGHAEVVGAVADTIGILVIRVRRLGGQGSRIPKLALEIAIRSEERRVWK